MCITSDEDAFGGLGWCAVTVIGVTRDLVHVTSDVRDKGDHVARLFHAFQNTGHVQRYSRHRRALRYAHYGHTATLKI